MAGWKPLQWCITPFPIDPISRVIASFDIHRFMGNVGKFLSLLASCQYIEDVHHRGDTSHPEAARVSTDMRFISYSCSFSTSLLLSVLELLLLLVSSGM